MNLKTEQGRKSAIEEIEQSFIKSLREIGVELSDEACCEVRGLSIELSYDKSGWFEVLIRTNRGEFNTINFGSTGSFTPENKEAYWRTIHAASILKNWDKVCQSVNEHCKKYSYLVEQIKKQNP
jgi:hypothetical protein